MTCKWQIKFIIELVEISDFANLVISDLGGSDFLVAINQLFVLENDSMTEFIANC